MKKPSIVKTTIKIERTTTITLDADQVSEILRQHFDAPASADVTFECGLDYLHDTRITFSLVERSE